MTIEETILKLRKLSTQMRHRGKRVDIPKEWTDDLEQAIDEIEEFTDGLKTSIAGHLHIA